MKEVKQIIKGVKEGKTKPVYLLMGEEPFFIDRISEFIENKVLTEQEKGFNQTVIYGRDVTVQQIIETAKRFPMMSEKQVVIVKEAQDLSRKINDLQVYTDSPQQSTILVLNYKYKNVDKRTKLYKSIKKNGLVFESKKLYDNQIPMWIKEVLKSKSYDIEDKASLMLIEFLGNDLSKINNELTKLTSVLTKDTLITPDHIELNIGISKEFNNFELQKAIALKDIVKSYKIINYFSQNSKNNPLVLTVSLLHAFFSKLFIYHGLPDKSEFNVARALGVNKYFLEEYRIAAKNYPMRKVSSVIASLRKADTDSKGVASNSSYHDILKELLFKILH